MAPEPHVTHHWLFRQHSKTHCWKESKANVSLPCGHFERRCTDGNEHVFPSKPVNTADADIMNQDQTVCTHVCAIRKERKGYRHSSKLLMDPVMIRIWLWAMRQLLHWEGGNEAHVSEGWEKAGWYTVQRYVDTQNKHKTHTPKTKHTHTWPSHAFLDL